MKKQIDALFRFIFKAQLEELNKKLSKVESELQEVKNLKEAFQISESKSKENTRLCETYFVKTERLFSSIGVDADINHSTNLNTSWAVVSIKGKSSQYLKFLRLEETDARDILRFLRRFSRDNTRLDASPEFQYFYKTETKNNHEN